jgi:kinesin family protein C2/C3
MKIEKNGAKKFEFFGAQNSNNKTRMQDITNRATLPTTLYVRKRKTAPSTTAGLEKVRISLISRILFFFAERMQRARSPMKGQSVSAQAFNSPSKLAVFTDEPTEAPQIYEHLPLVQAPVESVVQAQQLQVQQDYSQAVRYHAELVELLKLESAALRNELLHATQYNNNLLKELQTREEQIRNTPRTSANEALYTQQIAQLQNAQQQLQHQLQQQNDQFSNYARSASQRSKITIARLGSLKQDARSIKGDLGSLRSQARALGELSNTVRGLAKPLNMLASKAAQGSAVTREMQRMQDLYQNEVAARKRILSQLQELRGSIRVQCRVRPTNAETQLSLGEDTVCMPKRSPFEFDKVYRPESSQEQIYEDAWPLIASLLDGYNVCIMAYGQTGSGKTHTMQGTSSEPGIIPRALADLFARSQSNGTSIAVSILEIYNEEAIDLIARVNGASNCTRPVREDAEGQVDVQGLCKQTVKSINEVQAITNAAQNARAQATTNLNERSSRSHCIVTLYVDSIDQTTGQPVTSKLNLVDLAGSENAIASGASGSTLKETKNINL